jgi:hypothetical protein
MIAAVIVSGGMFVSLIPAEAVVSRKYGMAGCGLGSLLLRPEGRVPGVLQWITNGFGLGQGFTISAGTSYCQNNPVGRLSMQQQEIFVAINFDSLRHEIAAGGGQKLNSLGVLMGCPVSQLPQFSSVMRKNYPAVFEADKKATPEKLIDYVRAEMQKDSELADSCKITI